MKKFLGLIFGVIILIPVASAQTYVEVQHTESYNAFLKQDAAIEVQETAIYELTGAAANWFRVTGDADPLRRIPWRTRFANLVNNDWNYQVVEQVAANAGQTINQMHSYYTRTGINVFVPGSSSSMGTRSLEELVTNSIYFQVVN